MSLPAGPLLYTDPGSASLLLQMLAAGAAGLLVFGKLLWRRLRMGLGRRSEDVAEEPASGQEDDHGRP